MTVSFAAIDELVRTKLTVVFAASDAACSVMSPATAFTVTPVDFDVACVWVARAPVA